MSLSLAKRSLREFDRDIDGPKNIKKKKQNKPSKKETISREETIKKLLLLNNSRLSDETSRTLLKSANSKRKVIKFKSGKKQKQGSSNQGGPVADEAIFTEEDFQKFADEYNPEEMTR